jgi:DNA-binding NarL/FixJ family response regulator
MNSKGRLFYIHWNPTEAEARAASFREDGWEVRLEAKDGDRASRRILGDPPGVVVISLARLPSHGREIAAYLRSRKGGSEVPIVFVDGSEDAVGKATSKVPEAICTTSSELQVILSGFAKDAQPEK